MSSDRPRSIRLEDGGDVARVLTDAGLATGPVLVLVGGADGFDAGDREPLVRLFSEHVVPVVVSCRASVVDGGTDSGVMAVMGAARSNTRTSFQLVGVTAAGTVPWPGDLAEGESDTEIDPNHSHVVLVPGTTWGDESPWLSEVAEALSVGHASTTLLVNGGEISYDDVQRSLDAGRPVVVLAGSGRTADAIAAAATGERADEHARRIAGSPLLHVVSFEAPQVLAATLEALLAAATAAG